MAAHVPYQEPSHYGAFAVGLLIIPMVFFYFRLKRRNDAADLERRLAQLPKETQADILSRFKLPEDDDLVSSLVDIEMEKRGRR